MGRKRYGAEEIIGKLREAEVASVGRKEYGGLRLDQAKRLKKLVTDQALDVTILKEVSSGNF